MTTQLSPEKAVVTEPSFSLELVREAKQSEEFSAAGRTIQPKVVDEDNFQDISFVHCWATPHQTVMHSSRARFK
jgi:hypothetical protein